MPPLIQSIILFFTESKFLLLEGDLNLAARMSDFYITHNSTDVKFSNLV